MSAYESEIEVFENEQADELRRQGELSRRGLLKSAGFYVTHLLRRQIQAQMHISKGEILDYWVGRDFQHAPRGIGRVCMSFVKEGYNAGLERQERLRILVPTPGGFDETAIDDVDKLARPTEIYTERSRFDTTEDAFTPYARCIVRPEYNMVYSLDEIDMERQMQHPNFDQMISGRVTEQLSLLGRFQEDLVNWQVVAQRRTIEGESAVVDL